MPPKRNEDSKVKKPDPLRVPGNSRWVEFNIPTKGKQAVKEGVAGSLYVVGGAVYDDVENISGGGKSARGTGSRWDGLLGVVVLGSDGGWWAGGSLGWDGGLSLVLLLHFFCTVGDFEGSETFVK
jgi:hypothetical protein